MKAWNDHAEEKLGPTFVMVVVFLASSALLIGTMGEVLVYGDKGGILDLEGYDTIGGRLIDTTPITPGDGFDITNDDVVSSTYSDSTVFTFVDTDLPRDIDVRIVRENSLYNPDAIVDKIHKKHLDCIFFKSWRGWYWKYASISYETIEKKFNVGLNISMVDFRLGDNIYTLMVNVTEYGSAFSTYLWANTFHMMIGIPAYTDDPDLARASMWSIIGQMFTADLPGIPSTLAMFISIGLWAAVGFAAVTFISRFIPFLGAG